MKSKNKHTLRAPRKEVNKMVPEVVISTDGSCYDQGKENARAGWGLSVEGPSYLYEDFGRITGNQDSTRAEIYALLEALKWMDENPHFIVNFRTDSKMICDAITNQNIRYGSCRDLWRMIEVLMSKHEYRIKSFVHCPREENARADELAKKGAAQLLRLKDGRVQYFNIRAVVEKMMAQ